MVGGPHHVFRFFDTQYSLIRKKSFDIFGREVTYIELRLRGLRNDAIVYIGEVCDLNDLEAT